MDGPIKENLKVGAPFWAGRPDIYSTKSGEEKKKIQTPVVITNEKKLKE